MSPITPFITQLLYKDLYNDDVHEKSFPKHVLMEEPRIKTEDIMELNNIIWKKKKDAGLSLKSGIKELILPEKFECIEKDIAATHNPIKIKYGSHIEVVI